jgi:hypothetical protein
MWSDFRAHAQDIRRQTAQELKAEHGSGPAAEKAAAIAQRIGRSSVTSISSMTSQASGSAHQGSFVHHGSNVSFASGSVTFGDVANVRKLLFNWLICIPGKVFYCRASKI